MGEDAHRVAGRYYLSLHEDTLEENKKLKAINAELLEALEAFVRKHYCEGEWVPQKRLVGNAEAVIAKAKGAR